MGQKKRKLFCARDAFGIKPFYYTFINSSFVFSSEILPLTKIKKKLKKNKRIIFDFLYSDLIEHNNESFFEGIRKLGSGSVLKIIDKKLEIKKFWSIKTYEVKGNFSERKKMLDTIMSKSVDQSLISDVPIGIQLSGGLESNILLQYLEKSENKKNIWKLFQLFTQEAIFQRS